MNYEIIENKKNKTVTVVATATSNITKKDSAQTFHVRQYLQENKINIMNCIKEDYVNNRSGKTKGEWVFNTSSDKVLDKTPSPVVQSNSEITSIPEEETKAAGPKAKRQRKTTTKKAD